MPRIKCGRNAQSQANKNLPQRAAEDHGDHTGAGSPKSNADADLTCAAGDEVRHDAIEVSPDRGCWLLALTSAFFSISILICSAGSRSDTAAYISAVRPVGSGAVDRKSGV